LAPGQRSEGQTWTHVGNSPGLARPSDCRSRHHCEHARIPTKVPFAELWSMMHKPPSLWCPTIACRREAAAFCNGKKREGRGARTRARGARSAMSSAVPSGLSRRSHLDVHVAGLGEAPEFVCGLARDVEAETLAAEHERRLTVPGRRHGPARRREGAHRSSMRRAVSCPAGQLTSAADRRLPPSQVRGRR